jgi:hypothetical protein
MHCGTNNTGVKLGIGHCPVLDDLPHFRYTVSGFSSDDGQRNTLSPEQSDRRGKLPYDCRVIEIDLFADQLFAIKQENQCRRDFHLLSGWRDSGPLTALRSPKTTLYDYCIVCVVERGSLVTFPISGSDSDLGFLRKFDTAGEFN